MGGISGSGGVKNANQLQGTTLASSIVNSSLTSLGILNDVTITGGTITGLGTPTGGSDVATKSYVDATTAGLNSHTPVEAATTTALSAAYDNGTSGVGATLTNSGTQAALVVDGYSVSSSDRLLVKDQVAPEQNGIYTVTTVGDGSTNWVLTRAGDYDSSGPISAGDYTLVTEGTVASSGGNKATLWIQTTEGPFTVGTTPISFTQLSVAPVATTFIGNVTGSGSGTITLTVANGAVTNAMLAGSIAATNLVATDITTVGTIGVGAWHATKIGVAYGGTNSDLTATGGTSQVLRQSTVGGNITVSQLSSSDISGLGSLATQSSITVSQISNATIAASSSVSGTNTGDQTTVSGNAGTVTGLSVTGGKTLTVNNSLTLAGTDSTSFNVSNAKVKTIGFSAIGSPATGQQGAFIEVPVSGTITGWAIIVNAGTATVQTWKVASGTTAPTSGNSISTLGVSISTGTAIQSTDVTDFTTTTVTAGDMFAFNLSAVTGVTTITFQLQITVA